MAVKYHLYGSNNVKVSTLWLRVLRRADREGVRFTVTSGHRTFAEQQALFDRNMQYSPALAKWVPRPGRPLTAKPSHTAPHIRTDKPDHALDVNSLDGGEARLEAWLDQHGVNAENPVRGEAWHLELSKAELWKLWVMFKPVPPWRKARAAGAKYVRWIFHYADKHGIPRALALALVDQESNFLNQYGHDRDRDGNIIWHGERGRVMVSKANYQRYKDFRRRTGKAQGVGLTQLTSPALQVRAEGKGGGWNPRAQLDVGFETLAGHIKALGTFKGIGAYNGGRGNPQDSYARAVLAKRDHWRRVIN